MGLSVVIITKNEELDIEACLESVKWADEIVVVDALSQDATIKICERYTDKIYQREWDGYASQKNFGNSKCNYEWILSIDADERVPDSLAQEIKQVIHTRDIVAYQISRRDFMFGKWINYGCWADQWAIRLFRKDSASWHGLVHEIIVVNGAVGRLDNALLHFSHPSISEFVGKQNHHTDLHAQEWYEQGKRTNWIVIIFFTIRSFLGQYIYLQGFRDGMHGLILATLTAYYNFLVHAKLWDLWYKHEHGLKKQ